MSAHSGYRNPVTHGAKQAVTEAARRISRQWGSRERRNRALLAHAMQMHLLALLGLRPAFVPDRRIAR